MFPDAKQLYTAIAAVGREALIASDTLSLPWGQLFVTGRTPMPIAPLYFDVRFTDSEVERVDLQEHLTFKLETVRVEPGRNAILEAANATLTYEPSREFGDHFGRGFIYRIPGVKTSSVAESSIIAVCP